LYSSGSRGRPVSAAAADVIGFAMVVWASCDVVRHPQQPEGLSTCNWAQAAFRHCLELRRQPTDRGVGPTTVVYREVRVQPQLQTPTWHDTESARINLQLVSTCAVAAYNCQSLGACQTGCQGWRVLSDAGHRPAGLQPGCSHCEKLYM
jgi:hypothetical protein